MKTSKIFILALGIAALVACKQENPYKFNPGGLDASKPAVASIAYDAAASGPAKAAFTWDAEQALAAGATSFTLELTDDILVDYVKNNGTAWSVIYAPETSYVVSKGISAGKFYYVRIRANYDGYYYSNWTYLGTADTILAVLVGTGPMVANFGAPANLTAVPTETSFKASWDAVPFAETYTFEYKAKSAEEWSVIDNMKVTEYEVNGLVGETVYDYRVKANKGGVSTEYTEATVTTLAPSGFDPHIGNGDAFLAFLAEESGLAAVGAEYTLEADIDLSGKTVVPAASFKGVLNGKGHSIKGLSLTAPLFTTLSGRVKNLVLEGTASPEGPVFGVVAGDCSGSIEGVTNNVAVTYSAAAIAEPILVAGIVGQCSGELVNCFNEAAVSVVSSGAAVGLGVAGLAALLTGPASGCDNRGDVSFSATHYSAKAKIAEADVLPTVGGVAAIGAAGFSVSDCKNYGKVSFVLTAAETDLAANMNRTQIGGVVGAPCGRITNTHNYGEVNVSMKHSTPGTAIAAFDLIVCVGGIGGGDFLFTNTSTGPFSNTSYTNCVNEGAIIVDSDASKSNSAIGGIVGWPGQEKPAPGTSVSGCTNRGAITGRGAMKCRLGGIEGGSGVMENSVNEGVITLDVTSTASVIGSLCGFHSQGHAITACAAKGEIIAKCKATSGIGGLIGNLGNVEHDTAYGCIVDCKITTSEAAPETTGFVVGYFNGTSKSVTLGSAADPIQVSGSLNGAAPTDATICGTKNPDNHTINYVIK